MGLTFGKRTGCSTSNGSEYWRGAVFAWTPQGQPLFLFVESRGSTITPSQKHCLSFWLLSKC